MMIKGINYEVERDRVYNREVRKVLNVYLTNDMLNRITFVSKDMIQMAIENEEYRNKLENNDILVLEDKAVTMQGETEVPVFTNARLEYNHFLETMESFRSNSKHAFMLAESTDQIELCEKIMKRRFPWIKITESVVIEDECSIDSIINSINAVVPDIIISTLSSPMQEDWTTEHYAMLNAKLFLGFGSYFTYLKRVKRRNLFSRDFFKELRSLIQYRK